jgi:hypothetical protein
VDAVNRSEPDLILLVGDYGYSIDRLTGICGALYEKVMPRVLREFSRLRARDGMCGVLGNHDLDGGADAVARYLSSVGIRVLRDSHWDIHRNASSIRVIGVDDITHGQRKSPRLDVRLLQDPSASFILSHHPDFVLLCRALPPRSPTIVLSGHTHGGQITFPWYGAPITLSRVATRHFPAGFVPNDAVSLYVTRGVGEQVPLRLRAEREVTLLTLALR